MKNYIEKEWIEFRTKLGLEVGTPQAEEMEKAFYAGIVVMLGVNAFVGQPECSERNAMLLLSDIQKEVGEWAITKGFAKP